MGKEKQKKKFKDSKLFQTIKNVAPEVLDTVTDIAADVYPPLGVVNNLVDKALGVAQDKEDDDAVYELQLERGEYMKQLELYYADLHSARDMYKEKSDMADDIAEKIINWNLWLLLVLVIVQVLVIMFVDGQIAAVVTGVVGTITGALINERNTVVNFFFGSSKGSKDKDKKDG
jgi:hypothetical protein